MSSIDEKSQQYYASYNQYGNYFYIGRLFDNAGQFDSADSGGFRNCGASGRKHLRDPRFRISINQINLQVIFRQSSNASKLCSVVASDESFVTFLYINELYRKKAVFFTNRKCFFLHICAGNVLAFMENNTKIKKQGIFICFPETYLKFLNAN